MKYSAAQAAKAVGRSTATITRAIDKNRLSAVKDDNGAWQIDPAELHRVFEAKPPETLLMQSIEKSSNAEVLRREVEALTEKLRALEGEREREREMLLDQVADLRAQRDQDAEERRKLTAILTDQRDKPSPIPTMAAEDALEARRGGWWSNLWRRSPIG